jgi:hypothetical protein
MQSNRATRYGVSIYHWETGETTAFAKGKRDLKTKGALKKSGRILK